MGIEVETFKEGQEVYLKARFEKHGDKFAVLTYSGFTFYAFYPDIFEKQPIEDPTDELAKALKLAKDRLSRMNSLKSSVSELKKKLVLSDKEFDKVYKMYQEEKLKNGKEERSETTTY